jgi:AraC-like DNA-binding protein
LPRTTIAVVPRDFTAKTADPRVQLAARLLRKNAMSPAVRVKEIAATLHVSSSYLRHLFKKDLGMAPTQFVKVLRLRKAKKLIENTFLSVKEIMVEVGISDLSHFVRDYKAYCGETPSQARARAQRTRFPGSRRARNSRQ